MIARLKLVERGTRVAYEDAANPRREGRVEAISDGGISSTEYRVVWDPDYRFDDVDETTSDLRQHGWQMLADLPGNPFDGAEIISIYTREDAIRDGEIVPALDLTPDEPLFVRQSGWAARVDLTRAVADLVVPSDGERGRGQDVKGRLWDLLSMARMYAGASVRTTGYGAFPCIFFLLGRPGIRGGARTLHFVVEAEQGEDGLVVTILRRGES